MSHKSFVTLFAGIQWLVFMFANTVVIPLSISAAFQLNSSQTAGMVARSFILTGLACLAQVWMGHKFPLMEGQSGLWWGVILTVASMNVDSSVSLASAGGSLALGMFIGGLILIFFGLFGLHRLLNRLFTPIVMAVLLLLLAAQLMDTFFKGMMGISHGGQIQGNVALLSIVVVLLLSVLTVASKGIISNFSILIGLGFGWSMYALLFGSQQPVANPSWISIFKPFVWGRLPITKASSLDMGIVVAAGVTAILNTTNTIASVRAAEQLFEVTASDNAYRRSLAWSGFLTMISGAFSQVPYTPYTSSIGFLRTTRLLQRAPFVLGALMFTIVGLIPPVSGFFATMPFSIGASVLFVAYLQLFGSALHNIEGIHFSFRSIFRIALPVLTGLAIQSMPTSAFSTLPVFAQSIAGNGMIVGVLMAIVLENTIPWKYLES